MKLCDAFAMCRNSFFSEILKNKIDVIGKATEESEMIVIKEMIKEAYFQNSKILLINIVEI